MKCQHGDTPGVWSFRDIYGIMDASAVTFTRLRMRRKVWLDPISPTGAVVPIEEGEDLIHDVVDSFAMDARI